MAEPIHIIAAQAASRQRKHRHETPKLRLGFRFHDTSPCRHKELVGAGPAFGGYLVNKAIGLVSQKPGFRADDMYLDVPSLIDWSQVPRTPAGFEPVFHLLFEQTSDQSIYQARLPTALQLREYLQEWLRDDAIATVLNRLVNSTAVEVNSEVVAPFV